MAKEKVVSLIPPAPPSEQPPYLALGKNLDTFYLYLSSTGQVVGFKTFSERTLVQHIAPYSYWGKHFGKSNDEGISWSKAIDHLCRSCEKTLWTEDNLRRSGLWREGESIVAHFGDRILVDGSLQEGMVYKGMIYERGKTVQCDMENPLDLAGCQKFLDAVQMFPWTNPRYVPIYTGWCVLAFLGGALDWRPHIWITGKAESGKSKLVRHVTIPVLSGIALNVSGDTRMAGIEQSLKGRACPVVFDEIEGDDAATNRYIQSVLRMARGASVETGAKVIKGTATGTPRTEDIRSMFYFSSVAHSLEGAANTSRTEVVELDNALFQHPWEEVEVACEQLKGDFGARFVGRSMGMLPVIRENIKVYVRAFRKMMAGSARDFDMLAAFMAGYTSLISDKVVTEEWAMALVKQYDWKFERQKVRDEEDFWRYILSTTLPVEMDRRTAHATVGELLDSAEQLLFQSGEEYSKEVADKVLGKFGIKVIAGGIAVSTNSQEIRKALRGTKWEGPYVGTLKRIPGVFSPDNVMRFSSRGSVSRAMVVPLSYLREE